MQRRTLSRRQEQVLELAGAGFSNKLIAHTLGIAPSTVSTFLERARRKARAPSPPAPHEARARTTLASRAGDHAVLLNDSARVVSACVLTTAEKAVVELTATGLSNAAVARRRGCSARTVANQLASIYKKLGVGSRRELRVKLGTWSGGCRTE